MEEVVTKCRCCGQTITEYRNPIRRALSEALVLWLIELCEVWFRVKSSLHYTDISFIVKNKHERIASDYSLLVKFGLISRDETKAGHYVPTQRGVMFCLGKYEIPKYYLGGSDYSAEKITINDVLSNPPKCNWEYH